MALPARRNLHRDGAAIVMSAATPILAARTEAWPAPRTGEGDELSAPSEPGLPAIIPLSKLDKPELWSLSAYAILRPNSGQASLSPTGQLGGSQFGLRIQRHVLGIGIGRNISGSINFRASTAFKLRQGNEAALGLAIRRIAKVPVELIVERRIALGRNGRNAFAGLIATGINDVPLLCGFDLNGYAQGGIVGLNRRDGFVDGSLGLERAVKTAGSVKFSLGAGLWGAAQPGVTRLDVGPSVTARFRIGKAGVRLAGEWRERVSGGARPGSGPALAFGLDY